MYVELSKDKKICYTEQPYNLYLSKNEVIELANDFMNLAKEMVDFDMEE